MRGSNRFLRLGFLAALAVAALATATCLPLSSEQGDTTPAPDPDPEPEPDPEPDPDPNPEPEPDPEPDPDPNPDPGPDPQPEPDPEDGTSPEFWAVVDRHCVWCHTARHPTAGVDLENRLIPSHVYQDFANRIQMEKTGIDRLQRNEKQSILDWLAARGVHAPQVTPPASYSWQLEDEIRGLPDGSPAPGFAFVVEDGFIDERAWSVQTYTDRHGRTYKGIALEQDHVVDQSVFSGSRNPSSYLVFSGIPWHGRFYNSRMEGDVRVGRWMSVGMQTKRLAPPGRDNREYVRLQIDRDAIAIRSAPMNVETWPWAGEHDAHLGSAASASGFYLTSSEWLHFVFESKRSTQGVLWTARVTNPATGATIADLRAVETGATPLQGTFFLHAYSTGGQRSWANLKFSADIAP